MIVDVMNRSGPLRPKPKYKYVGRDKKMISTFTVKILLKLVKIDVTDEKLIKYRRMMKSLSSPLMDTFQHSELGPSLLQDQRESHWDNV